MNNEINQAFILWFSRMVEDVCGQNTANINEYHFFLDEAKRDIIRFLDDYLAQHNCVYRASTVAQFFGVNVRTVYRITKNHS